MYLADRARIMYGMNSGATWRLGHRPELDGLRGIAVLMVMAGHAWPTHSQIAMAGVGVFFTLSGFLITSLLLDELAQRGSVSLSRFYARRALRLLPAAFTFLAVFTLLGFVSWRQVVPVVAYVQNWAVIAGVPGGSVLHFWSLAVEEQFYFVWPAVLLLVIHAGRRWALGIIAAGAVASAVIGRILIAGDASAYRVAYGSDTNAVALLTGCALAVALSGGRVRRSQPMIVIGSSVALVALLSMDTMWQLPIVPMLAAASIYGLAAGGTAPGWLSPAWLTLVGKRSYALYIWSTPLAFGLFLAPLRQHVPDLLAVALYAVASWLLATASWYLVERPFLALKSRSMSDLRKPQVIRSNVAHAGTPVSR